MNRRLENKVALVIGAARGIGREIAVCFAEEGAKLVIADMDVDAGEATARPLGADFIRTDISSLPEAEAAVALALSCHGRLDVLVQNAGIFPWQLIENTSPDDWAGSWLSTCESALLPPARCCPP